jgi:hypothetical protein
VAVKHVGPLWVRIVGERQQQPDRGFWRDVHRVLAPRKFWRGRLAVLVAAPNSGAKLRRTGRLPGRTVITISARSPGESWILRSRCGSANKPPSAPITANSRSSSNPKL